MDPYRFQVTNMDTSPTSTPNGTDAIARSTAGDPWRILLIELLNLFGLVLMHSRNARGARATTVIFDQILRRLQILDRMPGHTGAIIVRKITVSAMGNSDYPDYNLTFGNQNFCRSNASVRAGQSSKSPHQLTATLDQAFSALHEQGIVSLFLQLPGISTEKIDQLRLSLNILARFRQAAENNASITFRYFGRAMTIPLVRDSNGKPDPNLTLVAGLNGLSAVNMREIVKQAVSFCKLSTTEAEEECSSDNYSKIFSIRGLRSQLIQPPLEINTLPWMKNADAQNFTPSVTGEAERTGPDQASPEKEEDVSATPANVSTTLSTMAPYNISLSDIGLVVDPNDQKTLESILTFDEEPLEAETLAKHLALINNFLHTLSARIQDVPKIDRFLDFLIGRFEKLPEIVLIQMELQRRGLKIEIQGQKLIVGMVHPRLVELITLIREKRIARQKIALCRDHASRVLHECQRNEFTDLLGIHGDEADNILLCLKQCFDHPGGFNRFKFIDCVDQYCRYENALFEMLWCVYRNDIVNSQERHAYQIALPLLTKQLRDATPVIIFLLGDLFQRPLQVVSSTDRNAFALATLLLRTYHKEQDIDITQTPEEVLAVRKSLNRQVLEQVSWRLDSDRTGILFKFKLIRDLLRINAAKLPGHGQLDDLEVQRLLALEREGLIFMALAGGQTSLSVFREALAYYGDPHADIYQGPSRQAFMYDVISHLQILLRGMARLGTPEDLDTLKLIEQTAPRLMALDADPAFARHVKRALLWVAPAIRSIQVQLQ